MNQPIINPVDTALIESELTPERFLRPTNKGNNEIYVVTAHDSPNTMREIGRLREIAFRTAGGGTGLECDIDRFDTMAEPCRQLIVWDPESKLILGGYRYICGRNITFDDNGTPMIATSHMFKFSQRFLDDYLPYTIELGRSFVRPEYQSSRAGAKAIYVLDNLWDGLGSLTVVHPETRYLFGKVTMYPSYTAACRDMILYFLNKYFPRPRRTCTPYQCTSNQHPGIGARSYLQRRRLQERFPHPQCACTLPWRYYTASGTCVYGPVADNENVWHSCQRRIRRR